MMATTAGDANWIDGVQHFRWPEYRIRVRRRAAPPSVIKGFPHSRK